MLGFNIIIFLGGENHGPGYVRCEVAMITLRYDVKH